VIFGALDLGEATILAAGVSFAGVLLAASIGAWVQLHGFRAENREQHGTVESAVIRLHEKVDTVRVEQNDGFRHVHRRISDVDERVEAIEVDRGMSVERAAESDARSQVRET
jgi:hypothetical protein